MTPIVHITDKEQALQRENANMLDTINKQAASIEKLRKVVEMKDLTIEVLKPDAERLNHLASNVRCASASIDGKHNWNFLYGHGWKSGATFREAIDNARKEQS